jgi:two-component system invasion response regulator UvrY
LTKDCGLDELVKAINTVYSGKVYFSSEIAKQLSLKEKSSPFYSLSVIEMQIVLLLIENEDIFEIGKRLYLSPKTVSTYRYAILKKVGSKSNVELIQLAVKEGLLNVPDF